MASGVVHVLVRVWLDDRPGALGQVASRIGAVRGDIVGVDVLETGNGVAVDEFAVVLADAELVPVLVREIEEVDGTSVEEVRVVDLFPDPRLDALESAAQLAVATDAAELLRRFAELLHDEFLAEWAAVVVGDTIVARAGDSPLDASLVALAAGTAASPVVARGGPGPDDVAVAVLDVNPATVLVGRTGHPFRRRERAQLQALARVADRIATLLGRLEDAG